MAKVKRESKLKNIASKAENGAKAGLILAADVIAQRARQKAPVDTGRLKRSITRGNPVKSASNWKIEIGTNVEYAPYQEFGTKFMEAQPYLIPALKESRDIAKTIVAKAIIGAILK